MQPDSLGAPFKVANISPAVGTVTDDRLAGITGVLGPLPEAMTVTSDVQYGAREREPLSGRTLHGVRSQKTEVINEAGWLRRLLFNLTAPEAQSLKPEPSRLSLFGSLPGVLLVLAGCATNPVTGAREFVMMSEAQEIAMGREADVEVRRQMGLYEDDALQRYVEEIGLALASRSHRPELPWSFAIVDSPATNAFAIPGGFIYLTRGIMPFLSDEADLAGVLGHEVGHVTARHTVRAYTRASGAQLGLLVGSIFSPARSVMSQRNQRAPASCSATSG